MSVLAAVGCQTYCDKQLDDVHALLEGVVLLAKRIGRNPQLLGTVQGVEDKPLKPSAPFVKPSLATDPTIRPPWPLPSPCSMRLRTCQNRGGGGGAIPRKLREGLNHPNGLSACPRLQKHR